MKIIFTIFIVLCQTFVFAVPKTYSGANGLWNTAANWSPSGVPTGSDDVVIPSGKIVAISANIEVKSVSVSGALKINDGLLFTVGSNLTSGSFTVNSGGSFTMGSGNDVATLVIFGDYSNSGITDFWKSTVIISGNLFSSSTSELQKQGNVVVGGNIIGQFDTTGGNGAGQIYAVNPNATVIITPTSIDNNVIPGTQVVVPTESQILVDLVNNVIYGGSCSFTISDISNINACTLRNAVFTSSASGTSPTFIWQVNMGSGWIDLSEGTLYSGVATSTLTITGVTAGMNNYKYRTKVTVASCSKNGNYGVLTVSSSPIISTQPINQLDCEGAFVSFNVVAIGSELSYTWQYKKPTDGSFLAMPTTNVTYPSAGKITIANVGSTQYPNGTLFRVVVFNGTCSETSNVVTLSVNEITSVTSPVLSPTQSVNDVTLCFGQSYSYTVITSFPSNVVSYQWKSSVASGKWTDVIEDTIRFSGTKSATLNIIGGTPAESAEYRVYIIFTASGADCNTTSSSRTRKISFLPLLKIPQTSITQPTCTLATGTISILEQAIGDTYSFDNGLTYQSSNLKSGLVPGSYKVIIKNKGGCLSPVSANVVIPSVISTWNGGSWSPSAPTVNDKIVFNGNYTASEKLLGCSCEIQSGTVTFPSEKTLSLINELKVTAGSLVFEDKSNLIQINNVANSGDITYKRSTSPISNFDYTYWSSPVSPQTLYNVSPNTLGDKFYSFDGLENRWVQENTSAIMAKGIGYIIRGPQSYAAPNIPAQYLASFIGVPNNGTISVPITTSRNALYLLGNPYPSALDADAFLLNNPVLEGTLYFWTHNTNIGTNVSNPGSGVYAYSGDDYASYNLTGGAATSTGVKAGSASIPGAINTAIPSGKIGSGQGFFAGTKTSGSVNFTNSMRVGVGLISGDNSQFFKFSSSKTLEVVEKNRVWLNLSNNEGAFKQLLIGYVTGATNEIDSRYDGESFDGNKFVDFYSISNDRKLVIQGRALPFDEEDKVSLGYKTNIEGAFTIAIDQVDGLFQAQYVFIEDKVLNVFHNLKKEPYIFNTAKGVFNNRFVLSYTSKTLSNKEHNKLENAVLVSNKNKEIKIISTVDSIDSVCVYDIMGKQIYKKSKVDSNQLLIHNLVPGNRILIVEAVLKNGERISQKIAY